MSITEDDWTLRAKCRGMEDALFPEGKDQKRARTVCNGCPVRSECLAEALDDRIEWGVWGGMTERERRQLLRQRPDITDWHAVLCGQGNAAGQEVSAGSRGQDGDDTPNRQGTDERSTAAATSGR